MKDAPHSRAVALRYEANAMAPRIVAKGEGFMAQSLVYEGTDAPREAMQGYLDWEFGLVAQLGRDGTHHFQVLPAA